MTIEKISQNNKCCPFCGALATIYDNCVYIKHDNDCFFVQTLGKNETWIVSNKIAYLWNKRCTNE